MPQPDGDCTACPPGFVPPGSVKCCQTGKPQLQPQATTGGCSDIRNWPDVDNGVVCGGCTLLVDQMASRYGGLCSNYCRAIGRECVGAWEEQDDTCAVESIGEWDPGLIWFRISSPVILARL